MSNFKIEEKRHALMIAGFGATGATGCVYALSLYGDAPSLLIIAIALGFVIFFVIFLLWYYLKISREPEWKRYRKHLFGR